MCSAKLVFRGLLDGVGMLLFEGFASQLVGDGAVV